MYFRSFSENLGPMAISSTSPPGDLELRAMFRKIHIKNLHWKGPEVSGGSYKICNSRVKDLCLQGEGSTLEPGSQTKVRTRAATKRNSESRDASFSCDENSLVPIRNTAQQSPRESAAAHLVLLFSFDAFGNHPQVGHPYPEPC